MASEATVNRRFAEDQEAGMIKYTRGKIQILDLEGLRETACECYEAVKDQHGQLLSPAPDLT